MLARFAWSRMRGSTSVVVVVLALGALVASACGSNGSQERDGGSPFTDILGVTDFGTPPPRQDTGPPPCTLGQPNACSSCTDVCPGKDDQTTTRTCVGRACGISCKGDYYDVDGKLDNGCEVEDDKPLHSTEATAIKLKDIDDCDGCQGCTTTARIPSDERKHADAPVDRATGVSDFFRVKISDTATCSMGPYVRLDASLLSADVTLEVTATFICDKDKKKTFTQTKSVAGASSVEITLKIDCAGLFGDDSGELIIEVKKTSTKFHSGEDYTLIWHG